MKKTKLPGDNFSLKTKKTEDPLVMQWINTQTNLMDSLRYLIEKEIAQNGVRNLQTFIPTERNVLHASSSLPQETTNIPPSFSRMQEAAETEKTGDPSDSEMPAEEEIDDEDIAAWT